MPTEFIAPCSIYYGCKPSDLKPYAKDKVNFVECDSCGIIWRDLTSCNDERLYDREYFERKGYDRNREHRIFKAGLLLGILEQHRSPGKLLEVGPAMGYNLEAAARRGWQSKGIDISDYAVEFCRKMGLDVEKGCLDDIRNNSYDAVLMKHVLEHYKDPFAALNTVRNLLNEKGVVQIIVPNADYRKAVKQRGKYKFYSHEDGGIEHFVYFNRKTLRDILEHTGFSVVQENYPLFVNGENSISSLVQRLGRRILSIAKMDQEIIAVAQKR